MGLNLKTLLSTGYISLSAYVIIFVDAEVIKGAVISLVAPPSIAETSAKMFPRWTITNRTKTIEKIINRLYLFTTISLLFLCKIYFDKH